jgi:flavorubredoxin
VKSVVVFDSRSGNTSKVAAAIAAVLGEYGSIQILAAADASATVWNHCDLLVVGGPTEGRHATPAVHAFFDRLPVHALQGVGAAAFDTRLDWPRILSGSAALDIRRWMRNLDADVVTRPESFVVSQRPALKHGELERSTVWARDLVEAMRPAMAHAPQPAAA